jgi:hypothetical protein
VHRRSPVVLAAPMTYAPPVDIIISGAMSRAITGIRHLAD